MYRTRDLHTNDLNAIMASTELADSLGGVVITNRQTTSGPTQFTRTAASHGLKIEIVVWNSPADDPRLTQAIEMLLRARPA